MQVINDLATARSRRITKAWATSPVLAEIVEVLIDLGGSAHRDAVIEEVAFRRSREPASPGLRRELLDTFEAHVGGAKSTSKPAAVHPAFGPDSRRWALTPELKAFMAKAEAAQRRKQMEAKRPKVLGSVRASAQLVRLPKARSTKPVQVAAGRGA